MRIHYLQHAPLESPARITDWAKDKSYTLNGTLLYENSDLPSLSSFDLLVILGGPMGIYDEAEYPWLAREKAFIKEAIAQRKLVLGICLGSQLITDAIGGKVYRNEHTEIGWHPVKLTGDQQQSTFFKQFPKEFVPFHWHGDTFELPSAIRSSAVSLGCANQAFEYEGHVVGLQFHLESSNESIQALIDTSSGDLVAGEYIQQPAEMLGQWELLEQSQLLLSYLLQAFEQIYESSRSHGLGEQDV